MSDARQSETATGMGGMKGPFHWVVWGPLREVSFPSKPTDEQTRAVLDEQKAEADRREAEWLATASAEDRAARDVFRRKAKETTQAWIDSTTEGFRRRDRELAINGAFNLKAALDGIPRPRFSMSGGYDANGSPA